jgi:hypothetical protein
LHRIFNKTALGNGQPLRLQIDLFRFCGSLLMGRNTAKGQKLAAKGSNGQARTRRRDGKAQKLRHVALIVESAVAPRRMMLTGVARYIQEHEPWAVYLKPFGVEQSLPKWLQNWRGDGIIARIETKAIARTVARAGLPVVDVSAGRHLPSIPWLETDDGAITQPPPDVVRQLDRRQLSR